MTVENETSCCGSGSCHDAAPEIKEAHGHGAGCCGGAAHAHDHAHNDAGRRQFLYMTGAAFGAVGAGSVAAPLINSLNPAKDTLAMSSVEVDISGIPVGESKTVMWQGKPVYIRRRTPEEIKAAQDVDLSELKQKQKDSDRVKKPEWLILVGICTHLGCLPRGQKLTDERGEFGGYFCPCHGSVYDTSGRIRKGPAPRNLDVPPYAFISDTVVKIG